MTAEETEVLAAVHHMPAQLSSFVGREREQAQLEELLRKSRLVTLTGPGGCGKTRLALRVAEGEAGRWPDGVWYTELVSVSDPALVPVTVAAALSVAEQPGKPVLHALADHLKSKQMLLVLDNCEHLVEACAALVHRLLQACSELRILTTSREALGLAGETVWRVPSLSVPDEVAALTVPELLRHEAIRLFVERAAAASVGFTLTPENAGTVVQICKRLDGLPLALELAATRIRFLTVAEIADRLDHGFRMLTGGNRSALRRHQTLRATLDWSYQLLSDEERLLWHRLSVFPSSFTLDAAEFVAAGPGIEPEAVLDLLGLLVGKSVVMIADQNRNTRYYLLETIRQFGYEKLLEAGEAAQVRQRYLEWYLSLATQIEPELCGADPLPAMARIAPDYDNMRMAMQIASTPAESVHRATIAVSLFMYWYQTGRFAEGRYWLSASLEQMGRSEDRLRVRALYGLGAVAERQGDFLQARQYLEEAVCLCRTQGDQLRLAETLVVLALVAGHLGDPNQATAAEVEASVLFEAIGDKRGLARVLVNRGDRAAKHGDSETARTCFLQALALMRSLGRQSGVATVLNNLGFISMGNGNIDEARAYFEESLALFRRLENHWSVAFVLNNLARLARQQGDYERALRIHNESLTMRLALGDQAGVAAVLDGLAAVACEVGQWERGAQLFGAADGIRESIQASRSRVDEEEYARLWKTAVPEGNERVVEAATMVGRTMALEKVVAVARELEHYVRTAPVAPVLHQEHQRGLPPENPLTEREREVVQLIAEGCTDREIGRRLCISPHTVRRHLENIFAKLEISSRSKLVAWAFQATRTF